MGGKLIAEISAGIDHFEQQSASNTDNNITLLRNSADFAKHYRTDEQFLKNGEDDGGNRNHRFLRGVAKLKSLSGSP